jgi:hypothetical protein
MSPLTGLWFNLNPGCYKHAAPDGAHSELPTAICLLPTIFS